MTDTDTDKDAAFLREAGRYFRKRPTGGEDMAYWANIANAENCERIAATVTRLRAQVEMLAEPAAALVADVKARHPGEELYCPHMRALDAALASIRKSDR